MGSQPHPLPAVRSQAKQNLTLCVCKMQIIPTSVLVGGSNDIKPVDMMNSILTQGPSYGWALQGHLVEDGLGKGRGGASSQEKPWKQEKNRARTSGSAEREVQAGCGWEVRLAQSGGVGGRGQQTFVEQMPGTGLDSLSIVPHLIFVTRGKYYWQHFHTFRKYNLGSTIQLSGIGAGSEYHAWQTAKPFSSGTVIRCKSSWKVLHLGPGHQSPGGE